MYVGAFTYSDLVFIASRTRLARRHILPNVGNTGTHGTLISRKRLISQWTCPRTLLLKHRHTLNKWFINKYTPNCKKSWRVYCLIGLFKFTIAQARSTNQFPRIFSNTNAHRFTHEFLRFFLWNQNTSRKFLKDERLRRFSYTLPIF